MKKLLIITNLVILSVATTVNAQDLFPANNNPKGKSGYINKYGKTVLPFIYSSAGEFSEGLAFVTKDGKGMFIDKKGKVLLEGDYRSASAFKNGLAKVRTKDYKTIFINKKGEQVIQGTFNYYSNFKEGLLAAKIDGKYGYYDTLGNLAIPAIYNYAGNFSDGAAKVTFEDRSTGFIDNKGKLLFKSNFRSYASFSEGLVALSKNKKFGFANKTGQFVITPERLSKYKPYYSQFKNGLTSIKSLDGKFGFINKKGEEVIPPTFTEVGEFENGFCKVAKTPKPKFIRRDWAYMNTKGEILTNYKYGKPFPFSQGMAIAQWYNEAKKVYLYDLINEKGEIIKQYEAWEGLTVEGFKNGLCLIYTYVRPNKNIKAPLDSLTLSYLHEYGGARYTYINKQGKIVWQSAPYYVCFPTYAKVLLNNGAEKQLSELKGGEKILSWDKKLGKYVKTKILDIEVHRGSFDLIRLGFIPKDKELTADISNKTENQLEYFEATPSHPLYGENGPIRMQDLIIGNKIFYSKGIGKKPVLCEIITIEKSEGASTKVINLKTDKDNYVINGVVVLRK